MPTSKHNPPRVGPTVPPRHGLSLTEALSTAPWCQELVGFHKKVVWLYCTYLLCYSKKETQLACSCWQCKHCLSFLWVLSLLGSLDLRSLIQALAQLFSHDFYPVAARKERAVFSHQPSMVPLTSVLKCFKAYLLDTKQTYQLLWNFYCTSCLWKEMFYLNPRSAVKLVVHLTGSEDQPHAGMH